MLQMLTTRLDEANLCSILSQLRWGKDLTNRKSKKLWKTAGYVWFVVEKHTAKDSLDLPHPFGHSATTGLYVSNMNVSF
jgi:hypothetical protein